MDTGDGIFRRVDTDEQAEKALAQLRSEYPKHGGAFYIGQNLEVNGSKFLVLAITKKTMTLKLLQK